jgi:hypothetical protein
MTIFNPILIIKVFDRYILAHFYSKLYHLFYCILYFHLKSTFLLHSVNTNAKYIQQQ